jgi:hypothetical protein
VALSHKKVAGTRRPNGSKAAKIIARLPGTIGLFDQMKRRCLGNAGLADDALRLQVHEFCLPRRQLFSVQPPKWQRKKRPCSHQIMQRSMGRGWQDLGQANNVLVTLMQKLEENGQLGSQPADGCEVCVCLVSG